MSFFLVTGNGQEAFPIPDSNPSIDVSELTAMELVEWIDNKVVESCDRKQNQGTYKVLPYKPSLAKVNNDEASPSHNGSNIASSDSHDQTTGALNTADSSVDYNEWTVTYESIQVDESMASK